MSDLGDLVRHVFGRFARPEADSSLYRATDENVDALDHRLTDVEVKQREIAARLRILDKAGNPRGIGDRD